MGSHQITPGQAAEDAYNVSIKSLDATSKAYQRAINVTTYLSDKLDNPMGRFSGLSYTAKSYKAMIEGLKHVETKTMAQIMTHEKLSFTEKIRHAASHVCDKFTHESTVAASVYFGKSVVIAPVAVGVGVATAFILPVPHAPPHEEEHHHHHHVKHALKSDVKAFVSVFTQPQTLVKNLRDFDVKAELRDMCKAFGVDVKPKPVQEASSKFMQTKTPAMTELASVKYQGPKNPSMK